VHGCVKAFVDVYHILCLLQVDSVPRDRKGVVYGLLSKDKIPIPTYLQSPLFDMDVDFPLVPEDYFLE
jgi:hypothetical protein